MWGIIKEKGQLRTGRCGLMLFRCDYAGRTTIIIIAQKGGNALLGTKGGQLLKRSEVFF